MKRLLTLLFVSFMVIGCAPLGPENAARAAFVQWADTVNRVPYQNVQVTVLEKDDAFATVKITAELRAEKDAPWMEQEAKTNCKKVGEEWQCEPFAELNYPSVPSEIAKELLKTSTVDFLIEYDADHYSHIFVIDVATKEKRRLAEIARCKMEQNPIIAPSGSKVAFLCFHATPEEHGIFVIDLDGTNLIRVKHYVDYDFSWAPDSQQIAFGGIGLVNSDGTNFRLLDFAGTNPTWSSDGKEIAFVKSGNFCKMNSDGSNARCTNIPMENPAWSPFNNSIAFIHAGRVWLIDSNGSNLEPLTWTFEYLGNGSVLAWSPNGKRLVMRRHSTVGDAKSSLLIDIDGKKICEFGIDSELNSLIASWKH